MIHFPGPGPQPTWKHPVYLITSAILGGMVSVLVQILLVLTNTDNQGDFSLATPWRIAFVALGIVVGWLVGRFWWRWVYIERRWAEKTPLTPSA